MPVWIKKNRQAVLRWGGTILAIVLIFLLLSDEGWEEPLKIASQIPAWRLALAFGLVMLSRFSIISRWYVLLRSAGINIRFRQVASLTFTGIFASNFLPTTIGGDVVRLAGAMQMGYDRAVCLASIAVDRLIGMASMILIAPLGFWQVFQTSALQATFLAGFYQRGLAFLQNTVQSFSLWFKKPFSLVMAFLLTWAHLLFTFMAAGIIIDGAGTGEHLDLWVIAGLWSLAYFITLVPISINGYGLHELSITLLLSQVAGLSQPVSLMVAVLLRLLTVSASLPGAFFLPSVIAQLDQSNSE